MPRTFRLSRFRYITYQRKNNCFQILMIIFFILMVMCTFRPMNTTDTDNYYEYYLTASITKPVPELSYVLISLFWRKVIGGVSGFRFVMLTYYLCTFFLLHRLLKKTPDSAVSFIIFFSFAFALQICIQVRAPLANMLLLSSIEDIGNRKIKKHYIKVFLACLIHMSSIVFVIIYPVSRLLDKYRNRPVMYALPFFAVISARISASFVEFIVRYGVKIGITGLERFSVYFSPQFYAARINPVNRISVVLAVVYYSFLLFAGVKKLNTKEIIYLIIIAYSIYFYFLGYYSIALIGYRFPESLNLVLIFAIPALIKHTANIRNNRILCYMLLFFYLVLINHQYETIPVILSCLRLA